MISFLLPTFYGVKKAGDKFAVIFISFAHPTFYGVKKESCVKVLKIKGGE
jgi:hypothetical protein